MLPRLLRRLLRPLVRMLIQAGITFPALADIVRQLYVDVAANDLLTDERARTDSRISILTGVHRKELRRLRNLPPDRTEPPPAVTVGSAVVARWLGAAPWIDAAGRPRVLPRAAPAGEASFDALVETATKDVRPRTVFEELLSQGLITVDDDERIALNEAAFVPKPGREEQLFYFARNLHDHIAAAVANVTAPGAAPFLDRSVHYDRLSPAAADRLEQFARAAARDLLLRINQEAIRLTESDDASVGPTRRVNLGVYLYREDEPPGEEP
jgi:hypothetical protein